MKRKIKINAFTLIAFGLVIILLISFIGKITSGFTKDWKDVSLHERNEDNLLEGKYSWETYNVGDGYTLTAKKDGTIILDGEYTGSSAQAVIQLERVTLAAGTYTLSGAPNGGNQTYHIRVSYNGSTVTGDFGANNGTFTLSSSAEVIVELVLSGEYEFNSVKIRPVIVEGDEIGDFYSK